MKRILKVLLLFITVLLCSVVFFVFFLTTDTGGKWIGPKVADYLNSNYGFDTELKMLKLNLPVGISIEGLRVMDENGVEPLLNLNRLDAKLSARGLMQKEINLWLVEINGLRGKFEHEKDPEDPNKIRFGFDFIVEAFTSETTETPETKTDTISSAWEFKMGDVSLHQIDLTWRDLSKGDTARLKFNSLKTSLAKMDFIEGIYHVTTVSLENPVIVALINESEPSEPEPASELSLPPIIVDELSITNLQLNAQLEHIGHAVLSWASFELAEVNLLSVDEGLEGEKLALNHLSAVWTDHSVKKSEVDEKIEQETTVATTSEWLPFPVKWNDIDITINQFNYIEAGSDTSIIDAQNLALSLGDINLNNQLEGHLTLYNLSFENIMNYQLDKLTFQLENNQENLLVNNLELLAYNSTLTSNLKTKNIAAWIDNAADFGDFEVLLNLDADLPTAYQQIPELTTYTGDAAFSQHPAKLELFVRGNDELLMVDKLDLKAGRATTLVTNAEIRNWQTGDIEEMEGHINLTRLNIFLPDQRGSLWWEDIQSTGLTLPDRIAVNGSASGKADKGKLALNIQSAQGSAKTDLNWETISQNVYSINGKLNINQWDLGTLLASNDIGKVTIDLEANADTDGSEVYGGEFKLAVDRLDLGYASLNTPLVQGEIKDEQLNFSASASDSTLIFDLNGSVNWAEERLKLLADMQIENIDTRLGYQEDSIIITNGNIHLNLDGLDWKDAVWNAQLSDFDIYRQDERYAFEQINLDYNYQNQIFKARLDGDFFNLSADGEFDTDSLIQAIQYWATERVPAYRPENVTNPRTSQSFTISADFFPHPILEDWILPSTVWNDTISLNSSFYSADEIFTLDLNIPSIGYDSMMLNKGEINVSSGKQSLFAVIQAENIETPWLKIYEPSIDAEYQNELLSTRLLIKDTLSNDFFGLYVHLSQIENGFTLSFDTTGIFIKDQFWSIPHDNKLYVTDSVFSVENFELTSQNQSIRLETGQRADGMPLSLYIQEFDLDFVNHFIADDSIYLYGYLGLEAHLNETSPSLLFDAKLNVDQFKVNDIEAGKFSMNVNRSDTLKYLLDGGLSGPSGDFSLNGSYFDNQDLDIKFSINSFKLDLVEPFLAEDIDRLTGEISGEAKISGNVTEPRWTGYLQFNEVFADIAYLNTGFSIQNERLNFEQERVRFNQFRLRDSENRALTINGFIDASELSDPVFDLRIQTSKFRLLNTARTDNDLFYGKIYTSGDIRLTGSLVSPEINATLALEDDTELTLIIPEDEVMIIENEGIVEFTRLDERGRVIVTDTIGERALPDSVLLPFTNMRISANVTVSPRVKLRIIIDERANDYLEVSGGGSLAVGMDESGLLTLSGRYDLTGGAYQMSFYNAVRRRFDIKSGSSIIWYGDPLEAEVDITAIYEVRTDASDLVAARLPASAAQDRQSMRQLLPFEVILKMEGALLQPEISFDMDMPAGSRSAMNGLVYGRIRELRQDESAMNKQVFSLLVLNRFLPESPDDFGGGGGLTSTARTSASKILTQQLNRLSSEYIPGVDITFDLDSYDEYRNGTMQGRTELQVQVSREFLDDRLIVEVGGNVELEGERRTSGWGDIAGDITLEYLITEDGRLRLKGFRRSDYESFPESQITETGVGILFRRDYDSLGDLFRRAAKTEDDVEEIEVDFDDVD